MKVKDLIWKDNTSEVGKSNGLIDLRSTDKTLMLEFIIKNHDADLIPFTDKFKLGVVSDGMYYIHFKFYPTIDECKKASQKFYKRIILNTFFKNQIKTNGTTKS